MLFARLRLGFLTSCVAPQSMAAPQRLLLWTPSSSRMEHQARWTCMPARWSHDNSVWHFSFICVLRFLLLHGLSSSFLFLSLLSQRSVITFGPVNCFKEWHRGDIKGGLGAGEKLFGVFCFLHFFLFSFIVVYSWHDLWVGMSSFCVRWSSGCR